jgi:cytidylate kinase
MRPGASELAESYIREWDRQRLENKEVEPKMKSTICFSRKIGVGALEIADILAKKTGYRVVDREILEHIANKSKLSERTVALFDERYPGRIREFLSMTFGEKSFIESNYTRQLFSAVFSISHLGPTIFVGRGVHLLLPRETVLAVRLLCSKAYRIERLARILNVAEKEAEDKLDQIDKEQRDFFKRVYGKKDASPYEFDLVINCDHIKEPQWAAEIIAKALEEKFSIRME